MRLKLSLLIALLMGLAFQVSADSIDEKLFNALNAKDVNKTPEGMLGSTEIEKKAGSLVCRMIRVVAPKAKPSYKCALVGGSDDDLYNALNVSEKNVTPKGLMGSRQTEKRVGDEFVCTRIEAVVPKPVPKTTCGFIYKQGAPASLNQEPEIQATE